ncbi:MAG: oligosaccharide flippase family protein [Candidatus Micrarchaeia archaeon]
MENSCKVDERMIPKKAREKAGTAVKLIERYSGLDAAYFLKGGAYTTTSNVITGLLSIAIAMVFANFSTPELFGEYKYFISIATMIGILGLSGFNVATIRSVAKGFEHSVKEATLVRLKFSALVSILLFGISGYFYFVLGDPLWKIIAIFAAFFPFQYSFNTINSLFVGRMRFDLSSLFNVVVRFAVVLSVSIAVILFNDLTACIVAYLAATGISACAAYWISIKRMKLNDNREEGLVRYGIHLTVTDAVWTISQNIDKVIIAHFLGYVEVAIFSIAQIVPNEVRYLTGMIRNLALPKMSESKNKNLWGSIRKKLVATTSVLTLGVLMITILLPYLVPFLFGSSYIESVFYAQILMLWCIPFYPIQVIIAFLQSKQEVKELYGFRIYSAFVKITLLLGLTFQYGLLGVVGAYLITDFLGAVYLWWRASGLEKKPAGASG